MEEAPMQRQLFHAHFVQFALVGLVSVIAFAGVSSAATIKVMTAPGFDAAGAPRSGVDWHALDVSDPGDGIGDAQNVASENLVVGTLPNGHLARTFLAFDIDDGINPADIISVTFNIRYKALINGAGLPVISLHHSQPSQAGDDTRPMGGGGRRDAYHDATFLDTGLDVVTVGDAVGAFYSLDVTSFVIDDLNNDGTTSTGDAYSNFGLFLDGVSARGDVVADSRYLFNAGDDLDPDQRPFLEFRLIPEPASLALFALGLLIVRRR